MASHNILKSKQGAVSLIFVLLILASVLVIVLSVASTKTKRIKFTQKTTAAISAKAAALTQKENILHDININSASIDDYYIAGGDGDCEASPPDWQSVSNYEYCLIDKGEFQDPLSLFSEKCLHKYELRTRLVNSIIVRKASFNLAVISSPPSPSLNLKLQGSDLGSFYHFGRSSAIDGNTIVSGPTVTIPFDSGAAYVFEKSGSEWGDCSGEPCTETKKLIASDDAISDKFGISVSVDGNTIVAGASGANSASGSAYVFEKVSGVWGTNCVGDVCEETKKLIASDDATSDYFGRSVAISGNTIVVGAYGSNGTNVGAAYVFEKVSGVWGTNCVGDVCEETKKLIASDAAIFDYFGISSAIDGNTIVVGAYGSNGTYVGAAYVFEKVSGVWGINCDGDGCRETKKLIASDAAANDYFGKSVAVDGDTIVVGASSDDGGAGSAYVFEKVSGVWGINCDGDGCRETKKLIVSSPDRQSGDGFGEPVAVDGNTIVAGAVGDNPLEDCFISCPGAAYVFEKVSGVWGTNCVGDVCEETKKLIVPDALPTDNDVFGVSVGINENIIVVGAMNDDVKGIAHVFIGSSPGGGGCSP